MNPTDIFTQLGKHLSDIATSLDHQNPTTLTSDAAKNMYQAAIAAGRENAWFTRESVTRALKSLAGMLQLDKLNRWLAAYPELEIPGRDTPSRVLVIMAGNIPLVGFHDMMCVLISGHHLMAKLSSHDTKLPKALASLLIEIEPSMANRITLLEGRAQHFDAVIATGSNNSSRYFDYYFGKYPHIIRKNRNSMAAISGRESLEELSLLGDDVFAYFGLGCRNVSMLWIPEEYEIETIIHAWGKFDKLSTHSKYMNNYDYQKAIMMVNRMDFTDTGFCLLKQDSKLHSPVSVVHCQRYDHINKVLSYIKNHQDDLQCIVASPQTRLSELPLGENADSHKKDGATRSGHTPQNFATIPPGTSQNPELWDYADGVDTMKFLTAL